MCEHHLEYYLACQLSYDDAKAWNYYRNTAPLTGWAQI